MKYCCIGSPDTEPAQQVCKQTDIYINRPPDLPKSRTGSREDCCQRNQSHPPRRGELHRALSPPATVPSAPERARTIPETSLLPAPRTFGPSNPSLFPRYRLTRFRGRKDFESHRSDSLAGFGGRNQAAFIGRLDALLQDSAGGRAYLDSWLGANERIDGLGLDHIFTVTRIGRSRKRITSPRSSLFLPASTTCANAPHPPAHRPRYRVVAEIERSPIAVYLRADSTARQYTSPSARRVREIAFAGTSSGPLAVAGQEAVSSTERVNRSAGSSHFKFFEKVL